MIIFIMTRKQQYLFFLANIYCFELFLLKINTFYTFLESLGPKNTYFCDEKAQNSQILVKIIPNSSLLWNQNCYQTKLNGETFQYTLQVTNTLPWFQSPIGILGIMSFLR